MVVLPAGLEVVLPAVAGDGHLHDLGGALVDRGDPDVPPDLLDHVLAGVAVTAEGLDGRIGRRVAGLGGEVLGDGPLGVERALGALVDPLGRLLDVGPGGLQADGVRDDQLCV